MLRIRTSKGVQEIEAGAAIEIIDETTGRLAVVVVHQHAGSVRISTPGEPAFNAYANAHNLKVGKVTVHTPTKQ